MTEGGTEDNLTAELKLWYRRLTRLETNEWPKNALEGMVA
jgi:hypothetical protein